MKANENFFTCLKSLKEPTRSINLPMDGELAVYRGLFLKSPETSRRHYGCHNFHFIFATSRFLAIKLPSPLGFSYIKNILKEQLFKTSGLQFDDWLFAPEKNSELSTKRPQVFVVC